jgi:hypothetical protein
MAQPNKGSAGKPNVSSPVSNPSESHTPKGAGGIIPPVGIVKGTKGK